MTQIMMTRVSNTEIIVCDDDLSHALQTSTFKEITDPSMQFLIALVDYLGFDAGLVLNFDKDAKG